MANHAGRRKRSGGAFVFQSSLLFPHSLIFSLSVCAQWDFSFRRVSYKYYVAGFFFFPPSLIHLSQFFNWWISLIFPLVSNISGFIFTITFSICSMLLFLHVSFFCFFLPFTWSVRFLSCLLLLWRLRNYRRYFYVFSGSRVVSYWFNGNLPIFIKAQQWVRRILNIFPIISFHV